MLEEEMSPRPCPFDLFKKELPIYTFKNTCPEYTSIKLDAKTTKVFYNFSRYEIDSDKERSQLLKFFFDGKSNSQLTSKLDKLLNELKGNHVRIA